MQKEFTQIPTLYQKIRDVFGNMVNHILKEEYRKLDVNEKLQLVTRDKSLNVIVINEKYVRSELEFDAYLTFLYRSEFNLDEIKDPKKRAAILKRMRTFILRVCWKMKDVFPFKNELLEMAQCLNPETFSFENWTKLGQRYEKVLQNNFMYFKQSLKATKRNYAC